LAVESVRSDMLEHQSQGRGDMDLKPEPVPEPKVGAGVHVLKYYIDTQGTSDIHQVAHIMSEFPKDQHTMMMLLHQRAGNHYVQQVTLAMAAQHESKPNAHAQPVAEIAPPSIDMPAPTMPPLELQTPMPLPPAPATTATGETASSAGSTGGAHQLPNTTVTPQVFAQYVAACRKFLALRFNLTPEQTAALVFLEKPIVGSALNVEVDNFPDVEIAKPDGVTSPLEVGGEFNSNFYTDLPKNIRPPGKGRVGHTMVNEAPVPGHDGLVEIVGGKIQMHFDIGNPEDVVGFISHMFGDLLFGQARQHAQQGHGDKPTMLK
jgi:hypothetical protein